jgi:lipopolysaccharide export system protein LptA
MKALHVFSVLFICLVIFAPSISAQQGQPLAKIHVDQNGNVQALDFDVKNVNILTAGHEPVNSKSVCQSHQTEQTVTCLPSVKLNPVTRNLTKPMNPGPNLTAQGQPASYSYDNSTFALTINVRVKNDGTSSAGANRLGYYLSANTAITTSDTFLGYDDVSTLSAGAYSDESISTNVSAYPGTWYVGFIIDYLNNVSEDNESDNQWYFVPTITVSSPSMPNLDTVLSHGGYSFTDPNLTINVRVENNGTSAAGPFRLGYFLSSNVIIDKSDILIGYDSFSSLSAGAYSDENIVSNVSGYPGIWWVGYFIDYLDEVSESNEGDNAWYYSPSIVISSYTPPTLCDLVVSSIHVIDYEGPEISYKLTVKNEGTQTTNSKFKNIIYLSQDETITGTDYRINDWNVTQALAPGQSKTSWNIISTVSGLPEGEYYLGVIADGNNDIIESNENNNAKSVKSPKVYMPAGHEDPVEPEEPEGCEGNMVINPGFTDGMNDWQFNIEGTAEAAGEVEDGVFHAQITSSGENLWDVSLHQDNLTIVPGHIYTVAFRAKAAGPREIDSRVSRADDPQAIYNIDHIFPLSEEWEIFEYSFVMHDPMDTAVRIVFNVGASDEDVYLDNICFLDEGQEEPVEPMPEGNMIVNSHFMDGPDGMDDWHFFVWGSADAASEVVDGVFHAYIVSGGESPINVSLHQYDLPIINGHIYTVLFNARADAPREISTSVTKAVEPFIFYSNDQIFPLTPEWQAFEYSFTMHEPTDNAARIVFNMGASDIVVYLDNIYLIEEGQEDPGQPEEPEGNMVSNWSFIQDADHWQFHVGGSAEAAGEVENGVFHAHITSSGENPGDVGLHQYDFQITNGHTYNVKFDARADDPKEIVAYVSKADEPFIIYNNDHIFPLTPEWQTFSYTFTMHEPTDPAARIGFELGISDIDVYLDNVSLLDITSTDIESETELANIKTFTLFQSTPNPFNPSTTIRYSIPKPSEVTLTIYDLLGREIETLVNKIQNPGEYSVRWNGQGYPSGIYICHLQAGDYTETRKLVLQK